MLDVRLHCMEKKNHMAIIWTFLHHNYIFFLTTSWNHGDVTFVGVCTKHVFISGEQNKSTSLQFYQTFYLYQKQMADSAIWQYCNFDNIWINFAAPVSWKICWAAVVKDCKITWNSRNKGSRLIQHLSLWILRQSCFIKIWLFHATRYHIDGVNTIQQ